MHKMRFKIKGVEVTCNRLRSATELGLILVFFDSPQNQIYQNWNSQKLTQNSWKITEETVLSINSLSKVAKAIVMYRVRNQKSTLGTSYINLSKVPFQEKVKNLVLYENQNQKDPVGLIKIQFYQVIPKIIKQFFSVFLHLTQIQIIPNKKFSVPLLLLIQTGHNQTFKTQIELGNMNVKVAEQATFRFMRASKVDMKFQPYRIYFTLINTQDNKILGKNQTCLKNLVKKIAPNSLKSKTGFVICDKSNNQICFIKFQFEIKIEVDTNLQQQDRKRLTTLNLLTDMHLSQKYSSKHSIENKLKSSVKNKDIRSYCAQNKSETRKQVIVKQERNKLLKAVSIEIDNQDFFDCSPRAFPGEVKQKINGKILDGIKQEQQSLNQPSPRKKNMKSFRNNRVSQLKQKQQKIVVSNKDKHKLFNQYDEKRQKLQGQFNQSQFDSSEFINTDQGKSMTSTINEYDISKHLIMQLFWQNKRIGQGK